VFAKKKGIADWEKATGIPQGLKPNSPTSTYVGAKAPAPYAKHVFPANCEPVPRANLSSLAVLGLFSHLILILDHLTVFQFVVRDGVACAGGVLPYREPKRAKTI
jgi:hypothetical protein